MSEENLTVTNMHSNKVSKVGILDLLCVNCDDLSYLKVVEFYLQNGLMNFEMQNQLTEDEKYSRLAEFIRCICTNASKMRVFDYPRLRFLAIF